jgi:hypothetical protein
VSPPGRWDELRLPNNSEMKASQIMRLHLDHVSAKVRSGPPIDDEEDYASPVWAGEVSVRPAFGAPVADPRLVVCTGTRLRAAPP